MAKNSSPFFETRTKAAYAFSYAPHVFHHTQYCMFVPTHRSDGTKQDKVFTDMVVKPAGRRPRAVKPGQGSSKVDADMDWLNSRPIVISVLVMPNLRLLS
jgi:hypothetical protein